MPDLIVEDGTIVTGANTLVSVVDYSAYAELVGVDIIVDARVALFKAMQFLNEQEPYLKGDLVTRDQTTAYPRKNLRLEGFDWPENEIPRQAIYAQINLALDVNAGIDLWNPPEAPNKVIRKERVEGVIDIEYAVKEGSKIAANSSSKALLAVLKKNNGLLINRA